MLKPTLTEDMKAKFYAMWLLATTEDEETSFWNALFTIGLHRDFASYLADKVLKEMQQ